MQLWKSAFVALTVATCAQTHADLPWTTWMSESLGPTDEDWFRYFYRKQERLSQGSAGHWLNERATCKRTHAFNSAPTCTGPIELWQEIVYFPLACADPCGKPHASAMGLYGWRHPHPYELLNPVLAIETDLRPCTGRQSWRFPNNRVEITLGMWE